MLSQLNDTKTMICNLRIPRWHDVLLEIYKNTEKMSYCEKLNRRIKASLTHLREIVKLLAKHKLIKIVPSKKINLLAITEKGKRVASSILHLKTELGVM